MPLVQEAKARLALLQKYHHINAFTYTLPAAEILNQVQLAQEGKLQGKLIALKANFCVKSWPSDACSKVLSGFKSPFDSTIVTRLKSEGAVIMGLTNMDEFAMGSTGETSVYGATLNPWGSNFSCGGSSSGSAAAVATSSVYCAIGSDTGGSVRIPASHCGVVGFKPTRGAISRYGLIAYANSLDVPGIFAQKVNHVSNVFDVIAGDDEHDMTSRDVNKLTKPINHSNIRIGLVNEFNFPELDSNVVQAWKSAAEIFNLLGLKIQSGLTLPTLPDCLPAYYVIALAEASSNLARYDGIRYGHRTSFSVSAYSQQNSNQLHLEYARTRTEGFGDEVQRRILMGSLALTRKKDNPESYSSDYFLANLIREKLKRDFDKIFENVDLILLPTSPWSPLRQKIDAKNENVINSYLEDTLTVPASLAGLPAISVPARLCSDTLGPIGVQIIGRSGDDRLVLEAASLLEKGFQFTPLVDIASHVEK